MVISRKIRRRVMHWVWRTQDDLPDRVLDSRIWDWTNRAAAWLGCRLAGHDAIGDQCHRPEHDFCCWCNTPMPFQAHRPEAQGQDGG